MQPITSNRDLVDRLEAIAADHRNRGTEFALALIKLDRFRQFNITHGFAAGDILLATFFERLSSQLRDQDLLLRCGSAEFLVVIQNIYNEGQATLAALKVLQAMTEAFNVNGMLVRISPAIGISLFPDHGQDAPTLLRHTESALVKSLKSTERYSFYEDPVGEDLTLNWDMASDLREAIDLDQFEMFFQPQIDIETGKMHGAEALLRWKHQQRGYIDTETFITLAEQGELIYDITDWTIHAVLWQMHKWSEMSVTPQIAVNLSPKIFSYSGLVESIANSARIFGSDLSRLTLEITESALVENFSLCADYLEDLRSLGINISIDDFGTGYSSIAYLKNIKADELKIDRSFVSSLPQNDADKHIVKSIINMARGFGLRVIAEGIENKEALEALKIFGCDIGQGYFISKPLARDDFQDVLQHYCDSLEAS